MNWKVRLRNGWFWSAIISLIGMVVLYWMPEFNWAGLEQILMSGLAILAGIGIITDPTTPGTLDSPGSVGEDEKVDALKNEEDEGEEKTE